MWNTDMDKKQKWEMEYERKFGAGDPQTKSAFELGWHLALAGLLERFRDEYYDQEGEQDERA